MILVCFLTLLGLGTTAAWFFLPPLTLRVAVGPMGGDNQKLLAAFVRGWEDAHPRVRMKLVSTTDVAASAQALDAGKVELAIVRSDVPVGAHGQTIAILRRDVVGLIVPPQAPIEHIRDLAGKSLGVVQGLAEDARILDQIFTHYQTPAKTSPRVALAPGEIGPAIRQKRVAAIVAVGPAGPGPLADAMTAVAKAGKGAPDLLEIEAAETIAPRLPGLEAADIAPGAFGGTPLRPVERVTTLAVTWRLVTRSSLPNYAAGELARLLFITRSKLVTMFPQAGYIEAPDTDKSGALPVHPGAAAYFNGEQTSVLERFTDVLYVGAIIVSLVGAVCAWIMTAWRDSGPRPEREQLQRLMTIFREAPAVGQDALDIFDKEVDEMVAWALERTADGAMQAEQFQVFSLVVTQVRQSIERRRERRG
jgi:TRAP-type uncharacterized transport system substrate-binding protein